MLIDLVACVAALLILFAVLQLLKATKDRGGGGGGQLLFTNDFSVVFSSILPSVGKFEVELLISGT